MRMIGRRLGIYDVQALLGAGGMGEVYRARDTKLGRDVAIKILPQAFASDPERLARFEREARVLASFTHPNIGAIYGVEEGADDQGVRHQALVLELVDGDTLAGRLARGPLSVDEALRVAGQIADALDAAHEKGIVHRDLKPANIKITPGGVVKVLDFGLAKTAIQPEQGSQLATRVSDSTRDGTVLGTAAYMSPEQARGLAVDKRTDIWAFGCVLFEMLTGRTAFGGPTTTDTLAAVLDREPDWNSLPSSTPASVREVIERCLVKDQKQRLRDIGDAGSYLRRREGIETTNRTRISAPPRRTGMRAALAAASVLVVAASIAVGWTLRRPSTGDLQSRPIRLSLPPPPNLSFAEDVERVAFALSPDGTQLAFVASDRGTTRVWLRQLSVATPQPIDGTEGARSLFWSPDSTSVAFFAGDKLKRISVKGGAPVTICDVPSGAGLAGSWSEDAIVFASVVGDAVYRVSIAGGVPVPAVAPDRARGEVRFNWPSFLPDGKRFMFIARLEDRVDYVAVGGDDRPPRRIAPVASVVHWVEPGYLVFARDGTLVAQRFDLTAEHLVGEPIAIASPVEQFLPTGKAGFTTSRDGTLAYRSERDVDRMLWFDRAGNEVGAVSKPGGIFSLDLSREGHLVLFDRADDRIGAGDLWVFDLGRNIETRITSAPTTEVMPVWAGDNRVVYLSAPPPELFGRDPTSGAEARLPIPGPVPGPLRQPMDVTSDGTTLAYIQRAPRGNFDVWTLSLSGSPAPALLLSSPFNENEFRFSPDGLAMAWISDDSGSAELYVAARRQAVTPIRVSRDGARYPRWSRSGRELFYLTLDGRVMAVPMQTTPQLSPGTPAALFTMKGKAWRGFDVAPDGRFLAVVPQMVAAEQPLNVVLNWTAGLPR